MYIFLHSELNSQTYLLANAENAAATLCEVLSNDFTATEIDAKMQSAKKRYADLKKRNEALKGSLEKNVKETKELDLACGEMSKWFRSINDRMKPNVKVFLFQLLFSFVFGNFVISLILLALQIDWLIDWLIDWFAE